jgi:hypothetical protein
MLAAVRSFELVQKAILAIHQAQAEMTDSSYNDFDRLAINNALEHLENALQELACFSPQRMGSRPGFLPSNRPPQRGYY